MLFKCDFYVKVGGHMNKTTLATILKLTLFEAINLIDNANLYYC